ncbi:hypothetical protein ACFQU2_03580 [Siccirubricoccus deserti]
MERVATIHAKLDDERARHRDKMRDLALARTEAEAMDKPAARLARMNRITQQEAAERDRHRRAVARLRERIASA